MSNVNLVTEEIDLISAKRLFETVKRIVKKLDPAFVISARSSG
jgi:flagellar basal body rod protein FlgG